MSDKKTPQDSEHQQDDAANVAAETRGLIDSSPSQCNDEVADLTSKLEKANKMIKTQNTAYQRAIRRAVLENDYVSKINNKLVQKVELQTREQGYSDKDLAHVQSICGDLRELVNELVAAKKGAEAKVEELAGNVEKMELVLSMQEEKVQELTTSVETSEEENQKLRAGKEALDGEVLILQQQKEALEAEKEGISKALSVGGQSDGAEDVSNATLLLIAEKEKFSNELESMRESRDETKAELESLQKRFGDAEEAAKSRIDQLEVAKRDAEAKVEELTSIVEKTELEVTSKEEKVQELMGTIANSEEQNKTLMADKEALDSELSSLRQTIESQSKELESSNAKEVANVAMNAAFNEQMDQSAAEKAKLQEELDTLVKEKKASEKAVGEKLARVEDENKRFAKSMNLLSKELVLANSEMGDSATKPVDESENAAKSIETEAADNLSIISALRLKIRFFQKSVSEKDVKITQIEKELQESFTPARESEMAASVSTKASEQAINEERERLNASIAERETEREKAELKRIRIVELEEQLSRLKEVETNLVSSNARLEEAVETLQSEKTTLEKKEKEQCDQLAKLELEVTEGASKIIELEESLEKQGAENQSIADELAKLTKDVEVTIAVALKRDGAGSASTLDDVRRIISSDGSASAEVTGQIKALEQQMKDNEDKLLSVVKERDELEEKYEAASEDLRDLQDKLESAVGLGCASK